MKSFIELYKNIVVVGFTTLLILYVIFGGDFHFLINFDNGVHFIKTLEKIFL